ncbi:hypothetical protein [Brevundimonas sp. G8]|uniref:hypothetical protein n=1 Tax=Brevundimonas sp. G8 TaxID=1350776 RepID=UPI0012F00340|nr:hypothetical protein [Brevundimonas sp. G8]VXB44864.1 conserved hypothetical protein [Brevundimonas sp. G8]
MQALVELIAGFIALLAAAVLSQFGVDTHTPSHSDREVRRVVECREAAPSSAVLSETKRDC